MPLYRSCWTPWILSILALSHIQVNLAQSGHDAGGKMVTYGRGEVEVLPDVAIVTFELSREGNDSLATRTALAEESEELQLILQEVSTTEGQKIDISPGGLSVFPVVTYHSNRSSTGLQHDSELQIEKTLLTISGINETSLHDVLDDVRDKGVNETWADISGASFRIDWPTFSESLEKAREYAIHDAKSMAKALTMGLGLDLVEVSQVVDRGYTRYPPIDQIITNPKSTGLAGGSYGSSPFSMGTVTIGSQVSIEFSFTGDGLGESE